MAIKSLLAAGLFAAGMAFIPATPAEAKTTINIGISAPGWDHHCRNHRGWRCGWHPGLRRYYYLAPGRPAVYYDYRPPVVVADRISCGRAHNIVERHGFNKVANRDCSGKYYAFTGRKNGKRYVVTVNSFSGNIVNTSRY